MDLVDEENVALAQIGEDGGQIAGLLDGRAGRHLEIGVHFAGQDVAERGLAQAGRAVEQHMIQRIVALPRRLHQNLDLVAQPVLADHLVQTSAGAARGRPFSRTLRLTRNRSDPGRAFRSKGVLLVRLRSSAIAIPIGSDARIARMF